MFNFEHELVCVGTIKPGEYFIKQNGHTKYLRLSDTAWLYGYNNKYNTVLGVNSKGNLTKISEHTRVRPVPKMSNVVSDDRVDVTVDRTESGVVIHINLQEK